MAFVLVVFLEIVAAFVAMVVGPFLLGWSVRKGWDLAGRRPAGSGQ